MSPRGRSDPGRGSGPPKYPGSFLLAFREAVARLDWRFERLIQDVALCVSADGKEHYIGIENLYRRARRAERQEWPELIGEFLRTVSSAEDSENLPKELSAVAGQLLLRVGQPLKLPAEDDAQVWSQSLSGTSLVVNLVIDYPNRMCYVTEKLVEDSGRAGGEWVEQARSNLLERTPSDCFQEIHEDSGLCICSVSDAYDSSRALLIDQLLPQTRSEGCLLVLPGRDELLLLPVTLKALPHIHLMKILAEKNYKSAPYPISEEVFWVHEGTWRRIPIDIKANEVSVSPPLEFIAVLNRLSAEAEADPDVPM